MKNNRHEIILDIIKNNDIETQEELVEKLKSMGFSVTQATVSRDINKLNLIKVTNEFGHQKYAVVSLKNTFEEKYIRVLKDSFKTMDTAANILVIKTLPGMANAATATIDKLQLEEIIGSIAGDDTIICVTKNEDKVLMLKNKLELLVN